MPLPLLTVASGRAYWSRRVGTLGRRLGRDIRAAAPCPLALSGTRLPGWLRPTRLRLRLWLFGCALSVATTVEDVKLPQVPRAVRFCEFVAADVRRVVDTGAAPPYHLHKRNRARRIS